MNAWTRSLELKTPSVLNVSTDRLLVDLLNERLSITLITLYAPRFLQELHLLIFWHKPEVRVMGFHYFVVGTKHADGPPRPQMENPPASIFQESILLEGAYRK